MAELSTDARKQILRGLMRYWSMLFEPVALETKADWLAAVNATDTWIDDNAANFNSALPVAAQSGLTATQKTLLFCVVALRRAGVSFLRRIVGEVG